MTNKDVIKQYVDTGLGIPKYQMDKLNENLLKTYLRKRIIFMESDVDNIIAGYEFIKLNEEQKDIVFKYKVKNGCSILASIFLNSSEELKMYYIEKIVEKIGYPILSTVERLLRVLIKSDKSGEVKKYLIDNLLYRIKGSKYYDSIEKIIYD